MKRKRRIFKDPRHQKIYDELREHGPDTDRELQKWRGMNGSCNAYVIGFTLPGHPPHLMLRRSDAYAAWCAGKDNAKDIY